MSSAIDRFFKQSGNDFIYTDEYHTFMASHIGYLRSPGVSYRFDVDPRAASKHHNNLHGLFTDAGVRYEDHQLLMMINGFTDPLEGTKDLEYLLIPNNIVVERLKSIYRTTLV